ncbi:MAG: hypothetical protein U0167_02385 [bacterium]
MRARSVRAVLASAGLLLALLHAPSCAEGVWVDVGVDHGTYVHEGSSGPSWEYFPPHPFGQIWPAGTLAYAEFTRVSSDLLPAGGDPASFVAGYLAYFNGGSCGCGVGGPPGACTLRFYYDDAAVAAAGTSEARLVLGHLTGDSLSPLWVAVSPQTADADSNFVQIDTYGSINGSQYYALFRALPAPPSIRETTWSRIKQLWR